MVDRVTVALAVRQSPELSLTYGTCAMNIRRENVGSLNVHGKLMFSAVYALAGILLSLAGISLYIEISLINFIWAASTTFPICLVVVWMYIR